MSTDPTPEHFCGCCGRPSVGDYWREDCRLHVLHGHMRPWEATYFAQHGKDCPFQIGAQHD